MGFKRFVAATSRDALRQVRRDLGDEAVILSSKKVAGGHHEILAAAADAVEAIVEESRRPRAAAPAALRKPGGVESFQDFLKRQAAAAPPARRATDRTASRDSATPAAMYAQVAAAPALQDERFDPADGGWGAPAPVEPTVFRRRPSRAAAPLAPAAADHAAALPAAPSSAATARHAGAGSGEPHSAAAPAIAAAPAVAAAPVAPVAPAVAAAPAAPVAPVALAVPVLPAAPAANELMAELHSLRSALQEQLTALSTSVAAADTRRSPLASYIMTRLLSSGFSVELARRISQHAPAGLDTAAATDWLQKVLATNLKCVDPALALTERQGVFALVGSTGVGKTTTVAKLAARFAVKYGTQALGLITLDAYRVAAHEQLRTYGRILGTPVHLAQDAATLRELLSSMQSKRLVLIDTCGVGPRDERLGEMLAMLSTASRPDRPAQPVLLLNAGSHAETLDETARAWRAPQAVGCILTKLDEAARVGGALDCALRYRLPLLALTNGQRVPEDLHLANASVLAHLALKPGGRAFALADGEAAALAVARA